MHIYNETTANHVQSSSFGIGFGEAPCVINSNHESTNNSSKSQNADDLDGRMQCLDLFSGCGGISAALDPYCKTVAYCDIDPNARDVLSARIQDGRLEAAQIFEKVQSISPESLASAGIQPHKINIIAGGFPCQDVSIAGRQMGLVKDTRSALWREIVRIARFCGTNGAEWIFLENVAGIIGLKENGIGAVLSELWLEGYDIRWTTLSCSDIKAIHTRDRWWCLCQKSNASNTKDIRSAEASKFLDSQPDYVHELLRRHDQQGKQACTSWSPELPAFRVFNGVSTKLDENNRVRCGIVGNSVSPPVARLAFETLLGLQYVGSQFLYNRLNPKKLKRHTQNFFTKGQLVSEKDVRSDSPKKDNKKTTPKTQSKQQQIIPPKTPSKKLPPNCTRITKKTKKMHEYEADIIQEKLPYGWVVEPEVKHISRYIGRQSFVFFSPCGRKFKHLDTVQRFISKRKP